MLCFSQNNFQPTSTQKFVMDWAVSHFIYERLNLTSFLSDHQTLSAHTNIIQFQHGLTTSFRWTHPGTCPFSFGVSKQCSCKRLKTRSRKRGSTEDQIILQCSECKHQVSFQLDTAWKWSDGKGGDGAWLVLAEMHNKKQLDVNKMDVDIA